MSTEHFRNEVNVLIRLDGATEAVEIVREQLRAALGERAQLGKLRVNRKEPGTAIVWGGIRVTLPAEQLAPAPIPDPRD